MWVCEFEVEGSGAFPVDMLRYDACYPATTESAIDIVLTRWEDDDLYRQRRKVKLKMLTDSKVNAHPTEGRWNSFGWHVLPGYTPRKV